MRSYRNKSANEKDLPRQNPRISVDEYAQFIRAMVEAQLETIHRTHEIHNPICLEETDQDHELPNTTEYLLTTEDRNFLFYFPKSQPFQTDEIYQLICILNKRYEEESE